MARTQKKKKRNRMARSNVDTLVGGACNPLARLMGDDDREVSTWRQMHASTAMLGATGE